MKRLLCIGLCILISGLGHTQKCMNAKYKLRGYFYAGTSMVDSLALGGFYADGNVPKPLTEGLRTDAESGQLQLLVKTERSASFNKIIQGFKVYLINGTKTIQKLPAQDSRLYIKRQAFYKNEWVDIEYIPSSWCGNSYHDVYIRPNEYWEFVAPCMKGRFTTTFRFELYVNDALRIYSNEFEGSFNKAQLKEKQGHQPQSIMDPYND